jgi:hypothetical protein
MQPKLRAHVAAILLLAPVAATLVAQPAAAQQRAVVAPSISSMALNADAGVAPGSTLRVQINAAPNAREASIKLGSSGITVPLRQQGAGVYTGSYVVRRADRIDPSELITASASFGDRTVNRQFSYPPAFTQAASMGAGPVAAPTASTVAIERFVMRPAGRIEPGRELRFRLNGAPGGDAWLDVPGVINGVDLAEVRPGVYEGTYTVRRRDSAEAFERAVATLRNGNQRATARVDLRGGGDWGDNNNNNNDRQAGRRDDRAPQITDMSPANASASVAAPRSAPTSPTRAAASTRPRYACAWPAVT